MESKKDIRKKIFAERKLHTDEQIEAMSRTITDKVTALPAFKNADRILVYADYNHEVVTEYLIKEAWKAGKEVAVPKVVGKDMVFYKLTAFGIGMILSVLLSSGLCPIVIGGAAMIAGCLLIR